MRVKNCIYSHCFQGYTFDHGIQVIQFQTFDRCECERFAKEFIALHRTHLYIHEVFTIHKNYFL